MDNFIFRKKSEIVTKGRKRKRDESSWLKNVNRMKRNEGLEYVSSSGKLVPEKQLEYVESCCTKKCHSYIQESEQVESFSQFYKCGNYNSQNLILSGLMKRLTFSATNKMTRWEYSFHSLFQKRIVCQQFLCNVFQIKQGRFTTIKKKLSNHESCNDKRGRHGNNSIRLTEDVKQLIQEHCNSIPHSELHYRREETSLKYFENSELNLKKLYFLFLDYYAAITGNKNPPIDENTYGQYFNYNVNFTFSKPRTDVCNTCFEFEQGRLQMSDEITDHKKRVNDYKE
ncbi:uncharacterized protein LOC122511964 [Leptopilina heterotoma]|uniref:uncharacterized protein LOC122511964 n=1 Tax=Leptopilina heterotoma TaxID=63436 RepID=UPI001CA97747|nr:uncharacterized protein LOC122511964 [Leptopilina heterotoma]